MKTLGLIALMIGVSFCLRRSRSTHFEFLLAANPSLQIYSRNNAFTLNRCRCTVLRIKQSFESSLSVVRFVGEIQSWDDLCAIS